MYFICTTGPRIFAYSSGLGKFLQPVFWWVFLSSICSLCSFIRLKPATLAVATALVRARAPNDSYPSFSPLPSWLRRSFARAPPKEMNLEEFAISNGNRTQWGPIWSVIIRVINKIGRPRSGSPICLITSMITDRIGRHDVLLAINHNFSKICDIISYFFKSKHKKFESLFR